MQNWRQKRGAVTTLKDKGCGGKVAERHGEARKGRNPPGEVSE